MSEDRSDDDYNNAIDALRAQLEAQRKREDIIVSNERMHMEEVVRIRAQLATAVAERDAARENTSDLADKLDCHDSGTEDACGECLECYKGMVADLSAKRAKNIAERDAARDAGEHFRQSMYAMEGIVRERAGERDEALERGCTLFAEVASCEQEIARLTARIKTVVGIFNSVLNGRGSEGEALIRALRILEEEGT